jgi:hypothetical protein
MQIANPIYDVVFKYLMEDAKIAKLLISSIIGEEIESLDFRPQEYSADIDKSKLDGNMGLLTVYRLDFAATIKTVDGLKQVLIEIQKAKYATDIMRFRAYLGGQYSNTNNTETLSIKGHARKIGIPIIGIYFLGHTLDYAEASIIGVNRIYTDLVTGEQLSVKESFIESLTHDSYVIQIPYLAKKRRNDLEKLLSIFDQSTHVDAEHHILNIKEEDYPKKHRSLIRRLQLAILEPEMRKQMEIEDRILSEFEDMQREIMRQRQDASEARQEVIKAKQEADEAKQKASEAKQEASEAKREASEAKRTVARKMKVKGMSVEDISEITGLTLTEIERM